MERVDQSFDPGVGPNGSVRRIAVQPDGKLIVAGRFTRIGNVPRIRLARLNGDGSLDPSFDPGDIPAEDEITDVAVEPGGKILISSTAFGGDFAVARLHADGSLDGTFRSVHLPNHPSLGPTYTVRTIKLLADGGVLAGGDFLTVGSVPRRFVAQLIGGDPPASPPTILSPPADRGVFAGTDVVFEVVAASVPPPTYQWQFEGADLPARRART